MIDECDTRSRAAPAGDGDTEGASATSTRTVVVFPPDSLHDGMRVVPQPTPE